MGLLPFFHGLNIPLSVEASNRLLNGPTSIINYSHSHDMFERNNGNKE